MCVDWRGHRARCGTDVYIDVVQESIAMGHFSDKHRPGLHRLCQPMQLSSVRSGFPSVSVHPETPKEGGSSNTQWTKEQ